MKIPIMLLFVSLTHTVVAMDHQEANPVVANQDQRAQNPITMLKGVVVHKRRCCDCVVTHDSAANTYEGTLENCGYTMSAGCYYKKLSQQEAQQYYQQLLQAVAAAGQV